MKRLEESKDKDDVENGLSGTDSVTSQSESHSPTTQSKTMPKKTCKPSSHLKIHLEMHQKKLLVEANICAEELQVAKEQKLNEEDQLVAKVSSRRMQSKGI